MGGIQEKINGIRLTIIALERIALEHMSPCYIEISRL